VVGLDIGKELEVFDECGSGKRSASQQLLLAKLAKHFGWNVAVADKSAIAACKRRALVDERPDWNDGFGADHFTGAPQLHLQHPIIVRP
jgi:hypothetical protein